MEHHGKRTLACILASLSISALLCTGAAGVLAADVKPIMFGASISLSGKYAQTGEHFRRGYELWRKHVNEKGGILGRKVEFIMYDDKSDPTTGVRLYEKLITDDKVDFVLGPYSSAVTFAVSNVTERYKQPMLAAGASSSNIWARGHKYIFMTVAPGETYLDGAIEIAAKRGLKRIAVIHADSLYTKTFAQVAIEKAKAAGLTVVYTGAYPQDATDVSALIAQMKAANPEVVLCGTYFQDATLISRQMSEFDVNVKILAQTVGPSLPEFNKNLGKLAEGIAGASQWEAIPTLRYPGIDRFVADFQKTHGYMPTYQAAESYGAMEVFEAAIKKVGSLDREKVRDAFASLDVMTIFGPYKVDDKGVQIAKKALLVQWQQGERKVIWPEEIAPDRIILPMPAWKDKVKG